MKTILILLFSFSTGAVFSQALEPTETLALLKVLVVNDNEKSLQGETVSFVGAKSKIKYSGITKADGRFEILIPEGDKYTVGYKAFTEDQDYSAVDVPSVEGFINFEYKLTIETPKVYTLDNVFFDSGKAVLKPESSKELDELSEYLGHKKTLIIEIAGHTDNVGAKDANQKLSEDRSNAVRNYLIKKGLAPERIVAKGYGDSQPIAENDTVEGKQKNRRTEVRTIKE